MRKIRKVEFLRNVETVLYGLTMLGLLTCAVTFVRVAVCPPSIFDGIFICAAFTAIGTVSLGYYCAMKREILVKTIEDLPEPLNEAIETCHGNTVTEVMEALRDERLEYLAIFDQFDRRITEGTFLSPRCCQITNDGYAMLGGKERCTFLHNHPSMTEGSFSCNDWKWFVSRQECTTMIVVTSHYTYTVTRPNHIMIDYEEFCSYVDEVFAKDDDVLYVTNVGSRSYQNHVSQKIADRYGFDFTVNDLRLEKGRTWLANNRRRIAVVTSCVVLALSAFFSPLKTTRDDLSVTVSVEEIPHEVNGHVAPPDEPNGSLADGPGYARPPKVPYVPYRG